MLPGRVATKPGAFARFFHGMAFPWKGIAFVFQHPRLIPLAFAPILATIATVALLFGAFAHLASAIAQRFSGGHGVIFGFLFAIMMALVTIAVYYVGFVAILSLASAPFCSSLSDRAEALATGRPIPRRGAKATLVEAGRGIVHALLALALYLAISLPISALGLLVNFIPLVGQVLSMVLYALGFLVTSYFFAYGYLDYPLSSRCAGFGEKWAYIGRHRAEALGFGGMVGLIVLVPIVNLLVAPFATVGAALLFVEIERGDAA